MFNKQNFCHVASNNRNEKKAGIFVYKTTDNLATVSASGYFNEKIIDLNLHDLIIHEQTDNADRTKVKYNYLAVTERTLDNVGTTVIKRDLDISIEEAIEELREYVDDTFVKLDGTSTMTGPLEIQMSDNYKLRLTALQDEIYSEPAGLKIVDINTDIVKAGITYNMTNLELFTSGTNRRIFTITKDAFHGGALGELGTNNYKWPRIYAKILNNGYDINIPETNSADTLALKSQVDDAANSGEQLYTTGVWYAKMYAATVVPTGAEYDGKNYADFSQTNNDGDPIIVIYEGQSGAWVQIATITPPATHNGYMTITSKIWDIVEQAGQQGGQVLWSHNQKTFTPYPRIVSFDGANITNSTFQGSATLSGTSTVTMPVNPTNDQIVNKDYVDTQVIGAFLNTLYPVGAIYLGTQNTCPLATLIPGSTWSLVATDKALWGGDGTNGNTTIAAGLPNITAWWWANTANNGNAGGAVAVTSTTSGRGWDGTANIAGVYEFNAQNSNSIYGNSTTVQPPAYRVNVWRRTA